MSDLKLFQASGGVLAELESSAAPLEKTLQSRFETNLETLRGGFLASDYVTTYGCRMNRGTGRARCRTKMPPSISRSLLMQRLQG